MSGEREIAAYYGRGNLLERLSAALAQDGVDPGRPSIETLAPYDQFHTRGLEATREIADLLEIAARDHILDIGSGIGGPARYMAHRFGCRVTGIDLSAEFCAVAHHLTGLLGLEHKIRFAHGNALAMPFGDASFDGAYSMNVSMNIARKEALYREIRRVLKPGAPLMLSEIARGPGPQVDYPTPWADGPEASFLSTPEETRSGLEDAGFEVLHVRTTVDEALAFGARSRERVARGEKPPHRAVILIHAEIARQAMANTSRGIAQARIVPIEVLCSRRP
ncbi:MAG TPA: class I SAM-dependent methyltransferase [Burkholderiales bacterium]|nr:class I SAM-dependent methyltransferase [Burkholderiales bacterium]